MIAGVWLATAASAALLTGTSVRGVLNFPGTLTINWFDPQNGDVPSGYLNSTPHSTIVTIGPAVEFGFHSGGTGLSADFTDTTLTITETALGLGEGAMTLSFSDTAFAGLILTEPPDGFHPGLTGSITGNTLTLTSPGDPSVGVKTAVFNFAPATSGGGVPLPLGIFAALPALALAGRMARRQ
jgi:hypothetical protein